MSQPSSIDEFPQQRRATRSTQQLTDIPLDIFALPSTSRRSSHSQPVESSSKTPRVESRSKTIDDAAGSSVNADAGTSARRRTIKPRTAEEEAAIKELDDFAAQQSASFNNMAVQLQTVIPDDAPVGTRMHERIDFATAPYRAPNGREILERVQARAREDAATATAAAKVAKRSESAARKSKKEAPAKEELPAADKLVPPLRGHRSARAKNELAAPKARTGGTERTLRKRRASVRDALVEESELQDEEEDRSSTDDDDDESFDSAINAESAKAQKALKKKSVILAAQFLKGARLEDKRSQKDSKRNAVCSDEGEDSRDGNARASTSNLTNNKTTVTLPKTVKKAKVQATGDASDDDECGTVAPQKRKNARRKESGKDSVPAGGPTGGLITTLDDFIYYSHVDRMGPLSDTEVPLSDTSQRLMVFVEKLPESRALYDWAAGQTSHAGWAGSIIKCRLLSKVQMSSAKPPTITSCRIILKRERWSITAAQRTEASWIELLRLRPYGDCRIHALPDKPSPSSTKLEIASSMWLPGPPEQVLLVAPYVGDCGSETVANSVALRAIIVLCYNWLLSRNDVRKTRYVTCAVLTTMTLVEPVMAVPLLHEMCRACDAGMSMEEEAVLRRATERFARKGCKGAFSLGKVPVTDRPINECTFHMVQRAAQYLNKVTEDLAEYVDDVAHWSSSTLTTCYMEWAARVLESLIGLDSIPLIECYRRAGLAEGGNHSSPEEVRDGLEHLRDFMAIELEVVSAAKKIAAKPSTAAPTLRKSVSALSKRLQNGRGAAGDEQGTARADRDPSPSSNTEDDEDE